MHWCAIFLLGVLVVRNSEARIAGLRWSTGNAESSATDSPSVDENACSLNRSTAHDEQCAYVQSNSDACEGGGYLSWTRFVICEETTVHRVLLIVASVVYLFVLFFMISSAADDFFSPNVSAIVAHLGISESVAGVTFLAFGNGAPDIFSAIASVLSSPQPKAGFALGELLGAGIFVTLMVTATIVLARPFKVAKFETVRDILFYLCAIGWILFVFLYDSTVHLWQPLAFLGFYLVYVTTVVFSHYQHKKRKVTRQSGRSSVVPTISRNGSVNAIIPDVHIISHAIEKINKRNSFNGSSNGICDIASESEDEDDDGLIWTGHKVVSEEKYRSRMNSALPPVDVKDPKSLIADLYQHLRPLAESEWQDASILKKIYGIIMIPIMFVFKLTMPLCDLPWSKPLCILQSIIAPNFFLFAVQLSTTVPIDGGPGLWAYALVISAVVVSFILIFTNITQEPRYYKATYAYAGFIMSIAWIYILASEVVGVVTMFGVISQLSHEILGLTILAWSNSIGDLIADFSVARQGYPNMALAAAIGGPLFNLLIGFGLPFSLARLKGTPVQINFSSVNHILVLFLSISLLFTLGSLVVQKFHVRRPYAISLIVIYGVFMSLVVLAETRVFRWGHDG